MIEIPKPVKNVLETLENHGYSAYLVGGCVRDSLMHIQPKDYDIATSARPDQVRALFNKTVPVGLEHGTVLVVEKGVPVEVTTFRKEGKYSDHRRPDTVEFVDDLLVDLQRRDFTINAMAWNEKEGLTDPFGGRQDLEDKIIRAVGDPEKRFEEDALRMLRAWRFAARLGFHIEPKTREAIKAKERLVDTLPAERVMPEIQEILQSNPQVLAEMTTLLKNWLPCLEEMERTLQNSPYHYTDVLHHTLDAISYCPSRDAAVVWALLFHDAGKPSVKTTDEKGDHFPKHPVVSAKIAARTMKQLRFPAKISRQIEQLVLYHDAYYAPKAKNLYKLLVERGWDDEMLHKFFAVQQGDILAHAKQERQKDLEAFMQYYEKEKNQRPVSLKQLAVKGSDVLAGTSLKGPQVRQALSQVLEYMFYHPLENDRLHGLEQIVKAAQRMEAGQPDGKRNTGNCR